MKRIIQYIAILVLLPFALHSEWEGISPFGTTVDGAFEFVIDDVAYVGGGIAPSGVQSNFQSYDPSTEQWTKLPDLPNGPRAWAFAFVANGKGYVGGGDEIGDLKGVRKDFWEYDPSSQKWTKKKDFPGGIRDGCYSFSLDNKGFVGAGFDGQYIQQDGYKYDPTSDSWTMIAAVPEPIIFPISFVIGNKAYVGMGGQGFDKQLKSMYSYDATLNVWSPIAEFPGEARQAASAFVYKEIAYVGGGMSNYEKNYSDVYTFNPKTNNWNKEDNMQLPDDNTAWSVAFAIGDVGYYGLGVDFGTFTPSNIIFKYEFVKKLKPIISIDPNTYTFVGVKVGESKSTQVKIKNIGDTTLTISELKFNNDESAFRLPDTFAELLPINIEPNDSTFIEIIFNPTEEKGYTDIFYISSNDKKNEIVSVLLNGNAISLKPSLSLSINAIDFGKLKEKQNAEDCFELNNTGDGELVVQSISLENTANGFNLDNSHSFPLTIGSETKTDYCLSFNSETAGIYNNNLLIQSNDPNKSIITIPLTAEVTKSPTNVVDFSESEELNIEILSESETLQIGITSRSSRVDGQLTIFDQSGKLIDSIELLNSGNSKFINLDKKKLPKVIFIRYIQEGTTYTHKYVNL